MDYRPSRSLYRCEVMQQWMWRKLMLYFLCSNGMVTTCVYAHALYLSIVA